MRPNQQRQPNRTTSFTTIIQIKNKAGQVVYTKEVVTAGGLIGLGHDDNLRSIQTTLLQAPSKENGQVAIVKATVVTNKGSFDGIGDANPGNVNAKIVPHFIRMAETRAKARALRDAVNVGTLALEELGSADEEFSTAEVVPAMQSHRLPSASDNNANISTTPPTSNGGKGQAPVPSPNREFSPMSEAQRRLLFRIATERGIPPENANHWLTAELKVPDLRAVSRSMASQAIDMLRAKANGVAPGSNGHTEGAVP
jgi:hypothetical protein